MFHPCGLNPVIYCKLLLVGREGYCGFRGGGFNGVPYEVWDSLDIFSSFITHLG